MRKMSRLFEIVQMLCAARVPLTGADLAERLEVAPRTIYRDIAALQAMRVPVEGERGIGYVLHDGFTLPPLMWGEAVPVHAGALDLARRGVRSTLFEANRSHAPVFGAESPLHDLLHDPQTAGGLLAAVPETDCAAVLARLEARGVGAVRIGRLMAGPPSITLI